MILSLVLTQFSGWTTGFVTEVFNYDTRGPTIIEHLTYWTASAMRLKGSCRTPEVGEEPVYTFRETPCTVYDLMGRDSEAALALGNL